MLFLLIIYPFTTSEQNLALFANNYNLEFKRNTVFRLQFVFSFLSEVEEREKDDKTQKYK